MMVGEALAFVSFKPVNPLTLPPQLQFQLNELTDSLTFKYPNFLYHILCFCRQWKTTVRAQSGLQTGICGEGAGFSDETFVYFCLFCRQSTPWPTACTPCRWTCAATAPQAFATKWNLLMESYTRWDSPLWVLLGCLHYSLILSGIS